MKTAVANLKTDKNDDKNTKGKPSELPEYYHKNVFIKINTRKHKILAGFILLLLVIAMIIFVLGSFLKKNDLTVSLISDLITGSAKDFNQYQGRTNILLLGIAGENHEGVDLTDTMIVVSFHLQKNEIAMISIPRDIWLESLKDKVNTAYHYGNVNAGSSGFKLAKSSVEEIIGQPVHYAVVVDFAGFIKLIDWAGGVDVEVENAFTDNKYPIPGKENDLCRGDKLYSCRFETVSFSKGWNHFDGVRALKFVRSRYADGDEGTDFARSKRQQKVLLSFQKKLLSLKNLSPARISELISIIKQTVKSDMTISQIGFLGKFSLDFKDTVKMVSLETVDEKNPDNTLFINPPQEKYQRWVLEPKDGNFQEVYKYVNCQVNNINCKNLP